MHPWHNYMQLRIHDMWYNSQGGCKFLTNIIFYHVAGLKRLKFLDVVMYTSVPSNFSANR